MFELLVECSDLLTFIIFFLGAAEAVALLGLFFFLTRRPSRRNEKELQKNVREFRDAFQEATQEIIKSYKSKFADGNQEIQKVLGEFAERITKEAANLSKSAQDVQNIILEGTENKILGLNRAAEEKFVKIQEAYLKTSAQTLQSTREAINKKVEEVQGEIEDYKKKEIGEIDQKIYQILSKVAKKTIGKAIDLSDHEKLVMEALEKAKREIF
ncbi:MAG: Uncharacterized protein G01um101430_156 [Parcubacteria group bacterium Gr01-1014_30]|nr:MAG: Uncharacterized protein G01um101430_156 [Parcubacteria group bacterium Gr01-1014_30]